MENSHLRQLLTTAKAEKRGGEAGEITDVQNGTAYDQLLAAYDLPRKTTISKGGWTKEMQIIYSQERDAFCDRFQKKYIEEERNKFAKAILLLAQQGVQRSRGSLKPKIFRRELPGTPRDAHYCRASYELRFTYKQIGNEMWVFNVYTHTSGPAHALNTIK